MPISRRRFHRLAGCGILTGRSLLGVNSMAAQEPATANSRTTASPQPDIAIATWDFGLFPCKTPIATLANGGLALDAVEKGIHVTEADSENRSVGTGGMPNADGVVQLDASIMTGDRRAGSVAALEGFLHPISVARRVMEKTPHVMLVGAGAAKFAEQQGFWRGELLNDREREAYARWLAKKQKPTGGVDPVAPDKPSSPDKPSGPDKPSPAGSSESPDAPENHDTIALLVRTAKGEMAGGCSTSGWGYKLAGRVGDSPIIGGGLYVDGDVGAAGATGLGEIMMRYCGSFLVVEAMRRGATPEQACEEAVRRILAGEREPATKLSVNFIALSADGKVGAAGTDDGFRYAIAVGGKAEILQPKLVR